MDVNFNGPLPIQSHKRTNVAKFIAFFTKSNANWKDEII